MNNRSTVHDVTYDLLRSLGMTTVFGNPGSTEQTFLQRFPDDFTYVLGLQEASVIAMADAFARTTRRPALANLHTSAGVATPWATWWQPTRAIRRWSSCPASSTASW